MANTESTFILATTPGHESYTDASLSLNPAGSPHNVDCSGLTSRECLTKKTKIAQKDYIYPCHPGGCK